MMQNPQARMRNASPLSMQTNQPHPMGHVGPVIQMGRGRGLPAGPLGIGFGGPDAYSAAASRTAVPIQQSQYSPPMSQHPSGSTDNSLSSRTNRSASASASHLSSASSVSRASDGVNGFYSPTVSDFGRGPPSAGRDGSGPGSAGGGGQGGIQPVVEETLSRHYVVLKRYLTPYLQSEAGNNRTTKARDKLLRLSATQFNELSTDVFDELLRREDDRKRPGGGVPPSLPPKNTFHPKRNQARKKLSTLPPDRFRQLATDVYFELERRIPRIAAGVANGEYDQAGSPNGSISSIASFRAPSRGGAPPNSYRGPAPGPGYRASPPGMRINGQHPPRHGSLSQPYSPQHEMHPPPRFDSRNRAATVAHPIPQNLQSNTLVPNKSTMVEDDETDEDDDGAHGLDKVISSRDNEDRMKQYESQIAQLQERIQDLETELDSVKSSQDGNSGERDAWVREKSELEGRLLASQQSLEDLHQELEQSHTERSRSESEIRAHTERAVSDLQLEMEELRRENEELRHLNQQHEQEQLHLQTTRSNEDHATLQEELKQQRALTDQVRSDSLRFLAEMRELSSQSDQAAEREEALRSEIASLEQESDNWKQRYIKARTQIRSLKATSFGLGIQHETETMLQSRHDSQTDQNGLVRKDGTGLVQDTDVTTYQLSIDALVYAARDSDPELALTKAKAVVKAVRALVADIDGDHIASPSMNSPNRSSTRNSHLHASVTGSVPGGNTHPVALKARISRDVNRLVTAARAHAVSRGMSPISLIDAAASNLTVSVVSLLLNVGIKPSPDSDLHHESLHMNFDNTYDQASAVQPLQLQRRNFGDATPPVVGHHFDEGMESPIIKSGFVGREQTLSPQLPQPLNMSGKLSVNDQDKENNQNGNGLLGSGWFNMLKSPASSHKGSMIESDGDVDSDDERYGFA